MNRLPELNALPDAVYRQTVERLNAGQKVATVARWLMKQYRGALQHEPYYNMRKHVDELKFCIAAHEQGPADSVAELPSPALGKKSASQVVPSAHDISLRHLEDVAATADPMLGKAVLILALYEQLDLLRELQHKGQQDLVVAVLQELRRIGEAMCKFDGSPGTQAWEHFDAIDNRTRTTTGNSAGPSATAADSQASEFDNKLKQLVVNPAELEKTIAVLKAGTEAAELAQQLALDADLNAVEPSNQ